MTLHTWKVLSPSLMQCRRCLLYKQLGLNGLWFYVVGDRKTTKRPDCQVICADGS